MKKIIYVSGGQRSGKSKFAQNLVESISSTPIYLATARIWDEDFKNRVKKHQADRGDQWTTIEEEVSLSSLDLSGQVVLLDCITLWLTNIFHDSSYDLKKSIEVATKEWKKFIDQEFTLVVVSNEIGMSMHSLEESARHFTDLQGTTNQMIANDADEAFLVVSGLPIKLK